MLMMRIDESDLEKIFNEYTRNLSPMHKDRTKERMVEAYAYYRTEEKEATKALMKQYMICLRKERPQKKWMMDRQGLKKEYEKLSKLENHFCAYFLFRDGKCEVLYRMMNYCAFKYPDASNVISKGATYISLGKWE